MKHFRLLIIALMTVVLGLVASPANAANAHIVKGPEVSVSGNSLTLTASIAGLGNVPSAEFTLSGTVDVFSRCYNAGGNKPQADNKQETIAVGATDDFPVKNGRTNVSFTITPLSTLTCPGNQRVVIESVSFDLTLSGQGIEEHITG